MFRSLLMLAALALMPATAAAQTYRPGQPQTDTNPAPFKCLVWNGTAYVNCGGGGDASGAWYHTPPSAVTTNGGTIATSGTTVTLTFTSDSDYEVMNPSTATLWASWGTPAVNGANSFPILTGGSYRPPSRVAGTLRLLSTAATQNYTFNRFQ
jgi:hypothetical protein